MTQARKSEKTNMVAELKAKEKSEPIASFLKMRLVELSPGYARIAMKVAPEYRNFNGFIFGGIIMSLADQAFAYAANSLAYPSVATQFNTHFIAGAAVDDELFAECRVLKNGKRVGISEITITNQEGKLIAKCTGATIPIG
ncbi:MAG: PaaI family thioesterase [Chloroflexi bacterium]|nr:PaaI family thioesterase [Chloroflexota bacterium]